MHKKIDITQSISEPQRVIINRLCSELRNGQDKIKLLFDCYDTNKDQQIDFSEFSKIVSKLGIETSEIDVQKVFNYFDINGDQNINQ